MPLDKDVAGRLDIDAIFDQEQERESTLGSVQAGLNQVPHAWALQALSKSGQTPFSPPPEDLDDKDRARIRAMTQEYYRVLRDQYITAALPACNLPTAWSLPVDLVGTKTMIAGAQNYQKVIDVTFPDGYWTRIQFFGVSVGSGSYPYDGQLRFRIRVNGKNVPGLHDYTQQRGSLLTPRPTFIIIPQGGKLTFEVERLSGSATYEVTATFIGYRWRLTNDFEGSQAAVIGY